MQDPRGGSIAKDAFLDVVRRSDGTPVDPEVVTQFNCLQQTGAFCPSASNGPTATSNSTSSSPATSPSTMFSPSVVQSANASPTRTSAQLSSDQAAFDAF